MKNEKHLCVVQPTDNLGKKDGKVCQWWACMKCGKGAWYWLGELRGGEVGEMEKVQFLDNDHEQKKSGESAIKIGTDGKIVFDREISEQTYDLFVYFMHLQFGGPTTQRTPTTDSLDAMADMLRKRSDEDFCYALCAEYISNQKKGGE